ncbi:hypothetical protein ACG0Z5_21915, partial [Scandinavium sp. M-37]|uniref:hypothetical protein n=1 Tax=Scandinavium sp. M-37 TaxID=3373077 RepID=UPI0037474A31
ITADYPPTNRKIDTGKTLKWWPVFVDHYTHPTTHHKHRSKTLSHYDAHTLNKKISPRKGDYAG